MPEVRSRQASIEDILTSLIYDGSFDCAVVASGDGLPVAMVGQNNAPMLAAVAASMKDLAERAHPGITEISSRDNQGNRVVSRYFSIDQDLLLLTVKMPAKHTYRRLTSKAISKIRQVWAA
ncbi:MAG TPA: roadblock/LC7 domain-containing protein [Chloroflexi bacterium]|nr:roadblock/LC7 domain-containing protein [Chloroflexota bacterium]